MRDLSNKILLTIGMGFALVSCSENHFKEDKIFAGGLVVKAVDLNDGKSLYTEYCMPCHGVNGDGQGFSAKGLSVPPRNFKLGQYKFGRVASGELPHDEDFYNILKNGLTGTAMLPWKEMSEKQMYNVVQYIKTFAPEKWEGADKKLGVSIIPGKDPYGEAHKDSAIQRGKEIYHLQAQCWSCHRAYVNDGELSSNGKPFAVDADMKHIKLQPNEYGYSSLPPEFTSDSVRSARTVEELFVRLSAGVGGTVMPSWKGTLQDDEIWAVAYYVKSLMDLKGTPARKTFIEKL